MKAPRVWRTPASEQAINRPLVLACDQSHRCHLRGIRINHSRIVTLSRFRRVLDAILALGVVISEQITKLLQAVAMKALKGAAGRCVQCLSVDLREAMIRN